MITPNLSQLEFWNISHRNSTKIFWVCRMIYRPFKNKILSRFFGNSNKNLQHSLQFLQIRMVVWIHMVVSSFQIDQPSWLLSDSMLSDSYNIWWTLVQFIRYWSTILVQYWSKELLTVCSIQIEVKFGLCWLFLSGYDSIRAFEYICIYI